ncbi:MAG: dienelactone hydrolase family protein, partial [Opitutales bacterium]|nr:dienelactone hydrolase family protein [Opitutales bacterium]
RVADRYKDISPIHNIRKGTPPVIVFLGDQDKLIPVSTAEKYKALMEKVGSRSDLHVYAGQPHGFFNQGKKGNYYEKTVLEMDKFLISLGWLKGKPTIQVP